MASNDEVNLFKANVSILSSIPVTFPDDYQPPPGDKPSRVPIFPVDILPPPERKSTGTSSDEISITFKALKPNASFTLNVKMTDTIGSIKDQLASQPGAPSADAQRLLLKGKALADGKLLKEYDVADGATVNLMIKPGYPTTESTSTPTPTTTFVPPTTLSPRPSPILTPSRPTHSHSRSHSRNASYSEIPSVVLSTPDPPGTPEGRASPISLTIPLSLDAVNTSLPPSSSSAVPSAYHTTIAQPDFWQDLRAFLKGKFKNGDDADSAFEEFLLASKGRLSPHEIAKIRDEVGIVGMAGH